MKGVGIRGYPGYTHTELCEYETRNKRKEEKIKGMRPREREAFALN